MRNIFFEQNSWKVEPEAATEYSAGPLLQSPHRRRTWQMHQVQTAWGDTPLPAGVGGQTRTAKKSHVSIVNRETGNSECYDSGPCSWRRCYPSDWFVMIWITFSEDFYGTFATNDVDLSSVEIIKNVVSVTNRRQTYDDSS